MFTGILARELESDQQDMAKQGYNMMKVVRSIIMCP